ncbi:MAG: tellurite resistance TerB family protein [Rhodanobacteraceae bacterium]|nr:tellurite resistance TerB family protein [Xanthomonadales bacterium]MCP5477861.1 tellurite resistance TerB family protein [Rhodanobacteraceae bacterium]HPF74328.1 DUF533 domain-containing protein [Xanthomonadaceae bacterium]HRY00170.1 DUF533 domain-containing protein [Xanthomonadaceae bacterium]
MFDPERLLGQVIGGGLGIGGRRGRRTASRAALGVGLLGIAMAAYEHYSQQSKATASATGAAPPPVPGAMPAGASAAPPPPPPPAPPADGAQRQADALLMLRAMIAAANADGHIDDSEREAVLGRAHQAGLDADDIAALQRELAAPWPVAAITATTQPAMRERVYLAARLAIDLDHPAEQAFLDQLAQGVNLDPARRNELEQQVAGSAD